MTAADLDDVATPPAKPNGLSAFFARPETLAFGARGWSRGGKAVLFAWGTGCSSAATLMRSTSCSATSSSASGRRFLWGDRLTLADLVFATALAPLLLPNGYTAPIPPYDAMPTALTRIIDAFRARSSAELVGRIYALRLPSTVSNSAG